MFLFPVKAMQSVYRALFMKGLQELIQEKGLDLQPGFSFEKPVYKAWKNGLYAKYWVIYAKRPFGGTKQVIEYLGRYTHKADISNHRIKSFDTEGIAGAKYIKKNLFKSLNTCTRLVGETPKNIKIP